MNPSSAMLTPIDAESKISYAIGPKPSFAPTFFSASLTGNHAPTTSNHTTTMLANDTLVFSLADFEFADIDEGDVIEAMEIRYDTLPNGAFYVQGQPIPSNNIGFNVVGGLGGLSQLSYIPDADETGTNYIAFTYRVFDGEAWSPTAIWNLNVIPSDPVYITGKTNVGQILTVHQNMVRFDDSGAPLYQWYADGIKIRGAISDTYRLTTSDLNKKISATVHFIDDFQGESSKPTTPITDTNSVATGQVKIICPAGFYEDAIMTVNTDAIVDANGLPVINGVKQFTYQWKANGINIAEATGKTLSLSQAEVGKKISVTVSFVDNQGNTENLSAYQSTLIKNINDAVTGEVTIAPIQTFAALVMPGDVLSASNTLVDEDGIATIKYQWFAGDLAIRGATSSSYAVKAGDSGKVITVKATVTDNFGNIETKVADGVTIGDPLLILPKGAPPMVSEINTLAWANSLLDTLVGEHGDSGFAYFELSESMGELELVGVHTVDTYLV